MLASILLAAASLATSSHGSSLPHVDVTALTVEVPASLEVQISGAAVRRRAGSLPLGIGSGLAAGARHGDIQTLYTVTDRGPNADGPKIERRGASGGTSVFGVPSFMPQIVRLELDLGCHPAARAIAAAPITVDGVPTTGLPPPPRFGAAQNDVPVDSSLAPLTGDVNGIDPEGIALDAAGNFWVAEEYGPSLLHVDGVTGDVLERRSPGAGLPSVLVERIPNRGFEGIAIAASGKVYAVLQSVLDVDGGTAADARFIRMIELDPTTNVVRTFAIPIDVESYRKSKDVKIGDLTALDHERFIAIEQGSDRDGELHTTLALLDLHGATDLTGMTLDDGAELEHASEHELGRVRMAKKSTLVDLRAHGWSAQKAEGLAILDDHTLAVMNDNDFGVAGVVLDGDRDASPTDYFVEDGCLELEGRATRARYALVPVPAEDAARELYIVRFDRALTSL